MSESSTNSEQELGMIDIRSLVRDFLHSLKRLWWLVVLLIAAAVLASYFRTSRSYTPTYVADATVSVKIMNGGSYASRTTAEQMAKVFPYILSSGALTDVIASDLGVKSIPSIRATNIKGTNLLTISVTSYDPQLAYKALQSVLKNFPDVAQYIVGQTELTLVDESGVPRDTGRTAVIRGSVKKGALLGLALALLAVAIHAMSTRTIRSESELRSLINIQYLGTLPACRKKERNSGHPSEINILFDSNRDEYVEAMRLIRTRIERDLGEKKVLMVTSSVAGEGKSTVAANLAVSMALKGKRVILVDCDLRNPSIARMFSITGSYPGLSAVLDGSSKLEDTIVEVMKDGNPTGLFLLPGADPSSRKVGALSTDSMGELLSNLREISDIIVIDTPPSALLFDAMMLVKHVDGVAYVVRNDYARRRYIVNGIQELASAGAPITGFIINGGQAKTGKYGYYSRYGGKYGYGYGYGYGYYGYGSESGRSGKSSKKHK